MKKVLMHVCCAPCFCIMEEDIKENGIVIDGKREKVKLTAFWYNPNIHPKEEYDLRLLSFKKLCKIDKIDNYIIDECDEKAFVNTVELDTGKGKKYTTRCEYCYTLRLKKTFEYARENGYDIVSTTLTRSPYQNHELINKIAERLSKEYGVKYVYLDYRESYRKGQERARELGLYMQKYCGCVYSNVEAYIQKKLFKYLKRLNISTDIESIRKIIEKEKQENNGKINADKIIEKYKDMSKSY